MDDYILKIYLFGMCMNILSECMYVHQVHIWYSQRPEMDLELKIIVSCHVYTRT